METTPPPSRTTRSAAGRAEARPSFAATLAGHGLAPLARTAVHTLQVNVGKLCNQACHHCHVEAGPGRREILSEATAEEVLRVLAASPGVDTVDFTGGAPELCPSFSRLVRGTRALGRRVMVRCNLTVVEEPGMDWLGDFYVDHGVHLVCSLPCYSAANVDSQRGRGVFDKSIRVLRMLTARGYGAEGSGLTLDLVYNPLGPSLPPPQAELEARYRDELASLFDIRFNRLLTITNMPIKRFGETLERRGEHERYMALLVNHFNPATVEALMCRSMVSVGWDGALYDCDFHQMADVRLGDGGGPAVLAELESLEQLAGAAVATRVHCYGCTAGAGSSCGGALES